MHWCVWMTPTLISVCSLHMSVSIQQSIFVYFVEHITEDLSLWHWLSLSDTRCWHELHEDPEDVGAAHTVRWKPLTSSAPPPPPPKAEEALTSTSHVRPLAKTLFPARSHNPQSITDKMSNTFVSVSSPRQELYLLVGLVSRLPEL